MSRDVDTITDERVAAIADRMVDEDKRVSPVAIWKELEGGSLVAIVEALQRWREARLPSTPDSQVQSGLPTGVAETIMSAADRIWTASQDEAEKAFNQRLSALSQHLDAALSERDEAFAEYQKTIEEVEAGRERLAAQTRALAASEDTALSLGAELVAASRRAEAGEARVAELEQSALADHARLDAVNTTLEAERRAREELVATGAAKDDEIARLTQDRDHARQQIATLTEAHQAKADEADRWSQDAVAATSRAQAAEARIEELEQQASVENAALEATRATLGEERQAREALIALVAGKDAEIAGLTQERDHALQQVATLDEACQAKSQEASRWSQNAAAATSRAQAAETRIEELELRVSAESAVLETTRATLEEERQAREALIAVVAGKDAEIARVTQDRDHAQQQIATLNEAIRAKSEEADRWSLDAAAATTRAQTAEARIEELERQASVESATLAATNAMLEEERQARAALIMVVAGKDAEIARVTQDRDHAQQQVATLNDACQAKSDEAQRWSQDAAAATSRAQTAEARIQELEQQASVEMATLEATRVSLEEQRQAYDVLSELVASKDAEITRVTHERDHAQQQAATLSDAAQAKSDEAARAAQDAAAATSRAQAAEARIEELEQRVSTESAALAATRATLEEARQAHEVLTERVTGKEAEIARLTQEHDHARQQLAALEDSRQAQSAELDASREQVGTLTAAAAAAGAELTRLSQEATAAKERADAAEQHATQLQQRIAERPHVAAKHNRRHPQPDVKEDETDSAEEIAALQRQMAAQAKAHTKAFDELHANAEQWVTHAKDLKQRLGLATERIIFIDARSTGEVVLVRRLSSELERLKPDHELISRDTQQKLIGATMAQQLAQKGYRYDAATAVMSKIER
ncbi:DNA-binding protein [Paraburkholderia bryophila]|uniref:DNA-binding protein n=1 Tax=Paraburkholderia bryophila TaxID=420952 RepID=UPI00234BAECC|nr:DNA-binding protein [Paraburkholderia bryophila]WCM22834.1 DNA-binding protein [Paraburkholderia bryophila]